MCIAVCRGYAHRSDPRLHTDRSCASGVGGRDLLGFHGPFDAAARRRNSLGACGLRTTGRPAAILWADTLLAGRWRTEGLRLFDAHLEKLYLRWEHCISGVHRSAVLSSSPIIDDRYGLGSVLFP